MVCAVPSLSYHARREVVERIAPYYREASVSEKGLLLDTVVAATGYTREYTIGLLKQPAKGAQKIVRLRPPQYGPQVQEALVLAWKVSDRICAKRLIPFLPTLIPCLERHGYLHLSEETRRKLLSMSTATADRVLQVHRHETSRSLSTTKAGSMLKQQIPLRTFHDWNDAQPGFVEADLVAHCAEQIEGAFLYTLTLTDVATGWTECLPLLSRTPDAVLVALDQARVLFPFPILGIDTDNGAEFINKEILAYCQQEQLTFTRGCPDLKNDQCFVEQKNGVVVRHFVGHERFVGQQAYRQLRELYRAVRLYVNCFQPSMKLQAKETDEHGSRQVYDAAKTPLQRVLLSGVLPEGRQQELRAVFDNLDPVALFEQMKQLQEALDRYAVGSMLFPSDARASSVLLFAPARCLKRSGVETAGPISMGEPALPSLRRVRDQSSHINVVNRPRSLRDPFVGEWEFIVSLLLAHSHLSSQEIFQEVQRRSPGRYHPRQIATLQRGVRKIRARLRATMEEAWPQEVIQSPILPMRERTVEQRQEEAAPCASVSVIATDQEQAERKGEPEHQPLPVLQIRLLTIEGAIQAYLQEQQEAGRSRKTLEWHRTALTVFEQYLRSERELHLVPQITVEEVAGWMECLRRLPTSTGIPREASTIETYARSVRAFCNWAMQRDSLWRTPFAKGSLSTGRNPLRPLVGPDDFDRLQQACGSAGTKEVLDWATARNRAMLWVFYETGMRVSELCGLRLSDVDREQGKLRVGEGSSERWMPLSQQGWQHLCAYLDPRHAKANRETLFSSEWGGPLTNNAITLVFVRLKRRLGMKGRGMSPLLLRESFAVRYLQGGGKLQVLCELLGVVSMESVKHYQRLSSMHLMERGRQKEAVEEHRPRPTSDPPKKKRRQKRASSRSGKRTNKDTAQGASGRSRSVGKQRGVPAQDGS